MVQTEDQYAFIHDALLEAVTCGNTEVPARNLHAYIQRLTQIEPAENVTGTELEFKVRCKGCRVLWCCSREKKSCVFEIQGRRTSLPVQIKYLNIDHLFG